MSNEPKKAGFAEWLKGCFTMKLLTQPFKPLEIPPDAVKAIEEAAAGIKPLKILPLSEPPPPAVMDAVKAAFKAAGLDPEQMHIVPFGKIELGACQCDRCKRAKNYRWN